MLVPYKECISLVMTCTLIVASYMWNFFNDFIVCLNSPIWFELCLLCIQYLELVQLSRDTD
jgi:general stress protein CsbA